MASDKTEETGEEKMTKLRGYIPTMTMMVFLAFASTTVNAGIIVSDRATAKTDTCGETTTTGYIVDILTKFATFAKTGIIVSDRAGIIVSDRNGIIVSDRSTTACTERGGIIVSD